MPRIKITLLYLVFFNLLIAAPPAPPASLVDVAPVTSGEVNPLQTFTGTLYYTHSAKLAAKGEGVVTTLKFEAGDSVKQGDVLAVLDRDLLRTTIAAKRHALDALEADLERDSRELARTKVLFEKKSISQKAYDIVDFGVKRLAAQIAAAGSEIDGLNVQLSDKTIRAPFDGVVTERMIDRGEWVAKGAAIATIVDTASMEATVYVPARFAGRLEKGMNIRAFASGAQLESRISAVIPQADKATRTFPLRIEVKSDAPLIEGMQVDVSLPAVYRKEALTVPRDAVIRRFGQEVVFAVVESKAMMLPVTVIGYEKGMAAVEGAGLQKGMNVVTKGNERIFPNMPVRIEGAAQ